MCGNFILPFQQSLNNVGHPILDPYKRSIEENFKSIKATLSQETGSGKKQLYPEQKEWSVSVMLIKPGGAYVDWYSYEFY